MDRYVFRKEVYEENVPNIRADNLNNNVYAYNSSIIVLEQNSLKSYNKMGNEEYALDITAVNPIFASAGNYLCIADKNGQKVYLISGRNIVWQKNIEGKINNISVNKNGYISVIASDTSYKTVIETYDNNGTELFKTFLATSNVIDIDISEDNKYLAIAEINLSGIVIQSSIKIISMENAKKTPTNSIIYTHLAKPDDLIINIEYNNRNNLICMYDGHIDKISGNNSNTELINYSNEEVMFVDINLNSAIAKVSKKNKELFNNNAEIQLIDTNDSNNIKYYEIEQSPKSVLAYENIVCINLGTEAIFIDSNGWLIRRYKSSQEIRQVVLSNGIAGIVYKNKIDLVSL